ncbi:hypothetical protein D3C81_1293940 [compost metagenome]
MAGAAVGLEVGEPDLRLLRIEGEMQARLVVAGRHAEPVLLVIGRHRTVAGPATGVAGLRRVGQAEAIALPDLQAIDSEVEPLEMRTAQVRPQRQQHLLRVAGIDDLDVAAVEIATNVHDRSFAPVKNGPFSRARTGLSKSIAGPARGRLIPGLY